MSHYPYFVRDGTACDICIPMPGCINGACKTEEVNGVPVEIAQTCQCNTFPEDHSLGNTVAKFEGPRCDRRKFFICFSSPKCSQLDPGFHVIDIFKVYCVLFKAVCKPACANGGSCVIAGDTRSNATFEDQGKCT